MRLLKLILALTLSVVWVLLLHHPIGKLPALGRLLHPGSGFWQQAESLAKQIQIPVLPQSALTATVKIDLDERLVPHIIAQNDADLYFAQGYLHAYYRLWQMDMQTRAAGGRISEVAGAQALAFDREQRRKGMVWAAETALAEMESDPRTLLALNAYTKGVNAYIHSLSFKDYPLEYKLMGFAPEPWTNLKCALLLKYMADDLTGKVDDIALSYLRTALTATEMAILFPEAIEDSEPVIPITATYERSSMPVPPVPPGELWAKFPNLPGPKTTARLTTKAASGLGSNNWVIGPERTADGSTLLCNDPHLGLNLPAIWYELQLQAPGINCYGVSIPGAPGIVIGFNDSISWGFTNNYRDVKDYYEIVSAADSLGYLLDGEQLPFHYRFETIGIKGATAFTDTVKYTVHGPLIYDQRFPEPTGSGKCLAMTWMAHKSSNELLALYLINRATDYTTFVTGIQQFTCPAQNFAYADRSGNIAMWGQGRFINKWKEQGRYVMRGDISATLWGDTIPMQENPKIHNPREHYLASANQQVTGADYPYWYNGDFTEFRSWAIHHFLKNDSLPQTVQTMMALQNNNYSVLAAHLAPLLDTLQITAASGKQYQNIFGNWNYFYEADAQEPLLFQLFWSTLKQAMWQPKLGQIPGGLLPADEISMQLLVDKDEARFAQLTGQNKMALLQKSLKIAVDSLEAMSQDGTTNLQWYQYKNTSLTHLARLPAFSYDHLETGGWGNTINAMKGTHGPSWRMIVDMNKERLRAFVVYPGGQSGNPGSRYYNNFSEHWVKGKYYAVHFYPVKTSAK